MYVCMYVCIINRSMGTVFSAAPFGNTFLIMIGPSVCPLISLRLCDICDICDICDTYD